MAKSRTNRRSKSKSNFKSKSNSKSRSRSKSKSRSRSRSRRGGAPVFVGSSWAPAASNLHRDLTAPSAIGNHFNLSPHGVPGGGFQPPVPEMRGPAMGQINTLSPPLVFKGGVRRNSGSKNRKGGGLFQFAQTAFDNIIIDGKNIVNGYNGASQLPSASPWIQPELTKPPNIPISKPMNLNEFKETAAQRAANA